MNEKLDAAFAVFNTYDWGVDPNVLEQPLKEAIAASTKDSAERKEIETRLAAVLKGGASRDAKDMACRYLQAMGTALSVPALAALLADENLSHMARYALERIPAAEAGKALQAALPKAEGKLKVGIISSLGARGEASSVALLESLLKHADAAIARAAAYGLGAIASLAAAKALVTATSNPAAQAAVADATMACAEALRQAGNKTAAKASYQRLLRNQPSELVAAAAQRGLDACK